MKELIGKEIKLMISGCGGLSGVLMGERDGCMLVQDDKGVVHRVPKRLVGVFRPSSDEPESEFFPLYVLSCSNPEYDCPGVQFVRALPAGRAANFKPEDFDEFMDDCPCVRDTCKARCLGDLAGVDRSLLSVMTNNILFGDYPNKLTKKEKKNVASRPRRQNKKTRRSPSGD